MSISLAILRTTLVILWALVLILPAAACGWRDVGTPRQIEAVRTTGATAAKLLASTLASRVQGAIQEGGLVYALDFCSVEARPLTAAVQEQLGGLAIKRATLQPRNPRNAPDADEEIALRYFAAVLAERGEVPAGYAQLVDVGEFRYYQPIVVAEGCLVCHGEPTTFAPDLQQAINERYPNDQAVGYNVGDLRGVVRVSVPTDRLR